jgi:hypothetical protein
MTFLIILLWVTVSSCLYSVSLSMYLFLSSLVIFCSTLKMSSSWAKSYPEKWNYPLWYFIQIVGIVGRSKMLACLGMWCMEWTNSDYLATFKKPLLTAVRHTANNCTVCNPKPLWKNFGKYFHIKQTKWSFSQEWLILPHCALQSTGLNVDKEMALQVNGLCNEQNNMSLILRNTHLKYCWMESRCTWAGKCHINQHKTAHT